MATAASPTGRNAPNREVRIDLIVGASLIAVPALGRLLWQASESGFLETFAPR